MEITTDTADLQRYMAIAECLVLGIVCVSSVLTVLGEVFFNNPVNEGRR